MEKVIGRDKQPLAKVEWVDRNTLRANDYNPNHVAPPELELLKLSIMETGWTQPIVARRSGEIVDGFHRWTCSGDPRVGEMTDFLVPVVFIDVDAATQRMATIRHNRARGSHGVVRMADIVAELADDTKLPKAEIMRRLGMDNEEFERLLDRGDNIKRLARDDFNEAWAPEEDK